MTGFLDSEIAPAIKPTPKNKGQNIDTKYRLNGQDLRDDLLDIFVFISKTHLKHTVQGQMFYIFREIHFSFVIGEIFGASRSMVKWTKQIIL